MRTAQEATLNQAITERNELLRLKALAPEGGRASRLIDAQLRPLDEKVKRLQGVIGARERSVATEQARIDTRTQNTGTLASNAATIAAAETGAREDAKAQAAQDNLQSTLDVEAAKITNSTLAESRAKREAENEAPVPNRIANLTGSRDVSIGEFKKQGGNIDIDDKEIRDLNLLKATTISGNNIATDLAHNVLNNPELLASPGAFSRAVNGLRSQLQGFANTLGFDVDETLASPQRFKSDLDRLQIQGANSAEVRSQITQLAFFLANAQNGGRVTEADVQKAITQIGGDTGSDGQLRFVLASFGSRLDSALQDRIEASTGVRPPPSSILNFSKKDLEGLDLSDLTDAELSSVVLRNEFLESKGQ